MFYTVALYDKANERVCPNRALGFHGPDTSGHDMPGRKWCLRCNTCLLLMKVFKDKKRLDFT